MRTTRQERIALGVVALLLAAGAGARWMRPAPPPAEWVAEAEAPAAGEEPPVALAEEAAERAERSARPLAPGERIDPNTADAAELDRLPRVGPGLAARIVAHREARGRFRTLADLDSVPGVGPKLLESAAPHLTLPAGPAGAAAARLDLNAATAAELERLPGIGPALAARVVEHRGRKGGFRRVEELEEVPGIGEKMLARVAPLVRVSP